MADNTVTVMWLTIIGLASITQTAILVGVIIYAERRWRRAELALRALEREHIAPAVARLDLVIGDMRDFVARARRADDDVRHAWTRAVDRAATVVRHAEASLWPAWGLARGVRAALSVLKPRRSLVSQFRQRGPAEAPFVHEGGNAHVRN